VVWHTDSDDWFAMPVITLSQGTPNVVWVIKSNNVGNLNTFEFATLEEVSHWISQVQS
jgi:hypothetical protein